MRIWNGIMTERSGPANLSSAISGDSGYDAGLKAWRKTHPEFEIDKSIQHKLLITVAPDGYLKRIA